EPPGDGPEAGDGRIAAGFYAQREGILDRRIGERDLAQRLAGAARKCPVADQLLGLALFGGAAGDVLQEEQALPGPLALIEPALHLGELQDRLAPGVDQLQRIADADLPGGGLAREWENLGAFAVPFERKSRAARGRLEVDGAA